VMPEQILMMISDDKRDILGIVRKVELMPNTKPCVQLFQHFAKGGRMLLNCDATGQLLNFPMVEAWKNKILHTKLAVSPKYPVINGAFTR